MKIDDNNQKLMPGFQLLWVILSCAEKNDSGFMRFA